MSMSKKDYMAVAKAIDDQRLNPPEAPSLFAQGHDKALNETAQSLARVFKDDNPRFCTTTFLAACGVQNVN